MKCRRCKDTAQVALPSHNTGFCPECFFRFYARQVERAIRQHGMLTPADKVLVALSGGKDSLALMLQLAELGYNVTGLHVDLGIPGSSPAARSAVERFCATHGLHLRVVETPAEGLAIPEVKARLRRPICSACGKIKRHIFDRVARDDGYDVLATGHNLDDETARLFANTLRWDAGHLTRQGPCLPAEGGFVRKVKPLYRLSEFENACFAFLKGIEHATAPCPYSRGASFTGHKELLHRLENTSPGSKINFYDGFLKHGRSHFSDAAPNPGFTLAPCPNCGAPTSQAQDEDDATLGGNFTLCGVCRIRELLAEVE